MRLQTAITLIFASLASSVYAEGWFSFDDEALSKNWEIKSTGEIKALRVDTPTFTGASGSSFPAPSGKCLEIESGIPDGIINTKPGDFPSKPRSGEHFCFWAKTGKFHEEDIVRFDVVFRGNLSSLTMTRRVVLDKGDWQLVALPMDSFISSEGANWESMSSLEFHAGLGLHIYLDELGISRNAPSGSTVPSDAGMSRTTTRTEEYQKGGPRFYELSNISGATIKAQILGNSANLIRIMMEDGRTLLVDIRTFSPASQDLVKKVLTAETIEKPDEDSQGEVTFRARSAKEARELLKRISAVHNLLPNMATILSRETSMITFIRGSSPDPKLTALITKHNQFIKDTVKPEVMAIESPAERLEEGKRSRRKLEKNHEEVIEELGEILERHQEILESYEKFIPDDPQLKFLIPERMKTLEEAFEIYENQTSQLY